MKKILLDTDIGNDIDDSLAITYLLNEPECQLLGITTVSGQPERRAVLAETLCKDLGKPDIPIFPGTDNPLIGRNRQPIVKQAGALCNCSPDSYPKNQAVDFLRRTIRENPGEITLLAIGPLTNIALLFSIDPDIPKMLKELVIMGGDFFRENSNAEWNLACDPLAAAIVYNTNVAIHRSIGLNVTLQVKLERAEAESAFSDCFPDIIRDYIPIWLQKKNFVVFHDPLAAMTIFDEKICEFKKGNVEIMIPLETPNAGKSVFHENPKICEVATQVNAEYALQKFFETITKQPYFRKEKRE